jgi:Tfp pilus assembly protein PilF
MKVSRISITTITLFIFLGFSAFTPLLAGDHHVDKALCKQLIKKGKMALKRGDFIKAKEIFQKAVRADPQNKTALHYFEKSVATSSATSPSSTQEEEKEEEWDEGC